MYKFKFKYKCTCKYEQAYKYIIYGPGFVVPTDQVMVHGVAPPVVVERALYLYRMVVWYGIVWYSIVQQDVVPGTISWWGDRDPGSRDHIQYQYKYKVYKPVSGC